MTVSNNSQSSTATTTATTATGALSSSSTAVPTNSTNNIINLPTPYETSFERIDLVPLKKQLDNVLKDRSEDYWEWIRRFLAGKLSKRELDYYVQTNLTEGNLHLHNQFFKAVIFNAFYSKTPPPPIVEQTKSTSLIDKKRKQPSSVKPSKKDTKKKKESASTSVPSTTTSATATATTSSSAPSASAAASGSTSLSSSSSSIKTSKKPSKPTRKPTTATSTTSSKPKKKHYPKYSLYASKVQALKEKMEMIASEHGLEGISKQSIIYMKLALEQHILNFVNRVKPHIISKNIEPSPQPNQIIPQEYLNNNSNNNQVLDNNIDVNNSNNSSSNSSIYSNNNISSSTDVNIQVGNSNYNDNSNINNTINNNLNINNNTSNNNTSNNNINNYNNNNNQIETKIFKFSDVFNFNKSKEDLKISYPKYIESNNPYLSQPTSFYKIPENIFSTSTFSNSESIITTQDIFTMVEENPYMLIDDPLSLERLNLLRY